MNKRLAQLLDHPRLRLGGGQRGTAPAQPTGFADLDAFLTGGGWPTGSLIEILPATEAIGELSLLMPALAAFSKKQRWSAWISPPHIPYPPALAAWGVELTTVLIVHAGQGIEMFWAAEQALRSGVCGAVLAWLKAPRPRELRRLQLAAEHGNACGFLFRPAAAIEPSPATLRLAVTSTPQELRVRILKGGRAVVKVRIRSGHAMAGAGVT